MLKCIKKTHTHTLTSLKTLLDSAGHHQYYIVVKKKLREKGLKAMNRPTNQMPGSQAQHKFHNHTTPNRDRHIP